MTPRHLYSSLERVWKRRHSQLFQNPGDQELADEIDVLAAVLDHLRACDN